MYAAMAEPKSTYVEPLIRLGRFSNERRPTQQASCPPISIRQIPPYGLTSHSTGKAVTQTSLLTAYRSSMVEQLRDGMVKIDHCLQQLSPEDIWTRPNGHMNSIANLLLHLAGNVRQWLICGLSDQPDLRNRQQEFDDRSKREPRELFGVLRKTIEEACSEINRQSEESLLAVRRVQQFECDGLQTIADSVCHFRGHVQEIIHMTRVLKEDAYQFHFVPENPE